MPTRRTILKAGLLGSAVLAVGGIGLGLKRGTPREPQGPLQALDLREFSTLAAAAEVLVPGGAGLPSPGEVQVAEQVDAFLARCHPGVQRELRSLLALLENALASLLLDHRWSCFSSLDADDRADVLASWQSSPSRLRRSGFKALHSFCSGTYWATPAVSRLAGYPGPPPWLLQARTAMGPAVRL